MSECGTGTGQVLAILYAVLASPAPRTIIIDGPQSYLHPGAAKKLIEILKEFPQHQYFITTHSAQIIAAANSSTIVKIRYEDGETQASTMNARDIREQRSLFAELGVSLSDVFGADSILWVEGPTEEQCFPVILSKVSAKLLTGTKIVSIKNTGDLLGKKAHFADVMFDLYKRISGGNNLYPPTVGFVFDKECYQRHKMNKPELSIARLEASLNAKISRYFDTLDTDPDVLKQLLADKRSENTRRAYERDVNDFLKTMTGRPACRDNVLDLLHLEERQAVSLVLKYKAKPIDKGLKEATVNRRLAAVKSLVEMGRKLGACHYTLGDIKGEKVASYRDTTGVDRATFERILQQCDRATLAGKRDYALLRLLWGNASSAKRNQSVERSRF